MAKISVIIPVYNVEQYLSECMDSVVNQTLKDIEIICVNDGSTDGSRKILQEYADRDERIKIIDQENGGLSCARNRGIRFASGEFIGFVDSDDWIDLDFYEKLYNVAVKYEADISCGGLKRFNSKNKIEIWINHRQEIYTNKIKKKFNLCKIPALNYVQNKIYKRKSLLKSGVLFEEGVYFEDIEFTHKILFYLPTLVTVPGTFYNYRNTPDSITNINSIKKHTDCVNAHKKAQEFIKSHNINYKGYPYLQKKIYKIFGIPILVFKSNIFQKKYYLFGLLEILHIVNLKKY